MEISHNDYTNFASVYIRGDKETIAKILSYAAELNNQAITQKEEKKD